MTVTWVAATGAQEAGDVRTSCDYPLHRASGFVGSRSPDQAGGAPPGEKPNPAMAA